MASTNLEYVTRRNFLKGTAAAIAAYAALPSKEVESGLIVKNYYKRLDGLLRWPLSMTKKHLTICSQYGWRKHPITKNPFDHHPGVDIDANTNDKIYAAYGGTITGVGGSESAVKIQHRGGIATRYLHCNKIKVKKKQKVRKGQIIGLVGKKGTATGPHLHYEIYEDRKTVDPLLMSEYFYNFTYKYSRRKRLSRR